MQQIKIIFQRGDADVKCVFKSIDGPASRENLLSYIAN